MKKDKSVNSEKGIESAPVLENDNTDTKLNLKFILSSFMMMCCEKFSALGSFFSNIFYKIFATLKMFVAGLYYLYIICSSYMLEKLEPIFCVFNERYKLKLQSIDFSISDYRPRRSSALLLLCIGLFSVTMFGYSDPVLEVYSNGNVVGYVDNEHQVNDVILDLEKNVSSLLDKPFKISNNFSYRISKRNTDTEILSSRELNALLGDTIDQIAVMAVIRVDGKIMGAVADPVDAYKILEKIKVKYAENPYDMNVEFVQNVTVDVESAPTELLLSDSELYDALTSEHLTGTVYTIKSGDTLGLIAYNYDTTVDRIKALNPGIRENYLMIGSEILLEKPVAEVSVKVTRSMQYVEDIPYETVTKENDNLGKNVKKTVVNGQNGKANVSADVVFIDGVEESRTINSKQVMSQPVAKVVEYGTKVSATVGTGKLIMPFYGRRTSPYGYRGSEFHTGVDWAGKTGSAIVAADSGKVTFSGYKGNYGKCVFIDHGNGMVTVYAHASSLDVQVGDVVERGQVIARVGSTGRSTGPHLHFEVRINGKHVNPTKYLK